VKKLAAPVQRLAYNREEAAASLGVGLTTFKTKIAPELRVVRDGKVRLYAVKELERWLERRGERVLEAVESDDQLDAPARRTPPGAGAGSRTTRPDTE
jgi:hypothetical protein